MEILVNKTQIVELYTVDKRDFMGCQECDYRIEIHKGEEVRSWFLNRLKYIAQEDLCRRYFDFEYIIPRSEVNKILLDPEQNSFREIFLEDGIVYRKPYVFISLSDGKSYRKYFDTLDMAEQYKNSFANDSMFFPLTNLYIA